MLDVYDLRKKKGKSELNEYLLRRQSLLFNTSLFDTVRDICESVRREGDRAVLDFTERFDHIRLSPDKIRVSRSRILAALKKIDSKFKETILHAANNLQTFHKEQIGKTFSIKRRAGGWMGEIVRPIEAVGLYVPGGVAPLVSTILMTVVPAKIAGCKEIVICTPPGKSGKIKYEILATCSILGVEDAFAIGGAQAIAAMAYGTETIPQVDFIAGPGNVYVTTAKKIVSGRVGIDTMAGPTEIVIIADDTATPDFVAIDLLSQAEHDVNATSILLTSSLSLARRVKTSITKQLSSLKRKDIIKRSLKNNGAIVVTRNITEAIRITNDLAPEHLEIMTKRPEKILEDVKHAGTVFLGQYTPVTVGDYAAGPNHVLPTARTARFYSPLSVRHFQKHTNVISLDKTSLEEEAGLYKSLADIENLDAHGKTVDIRLKK